MNSNPLANIAPNSLSLASKAIDVTQKLLAESQFEFYGDFKGEVIWEQEYDLEDFNNPTRPHIEIKAVGVNPNGDKLFVVCDDGYLRVLDSKSGEKISEVKYFDTTQKAKICDLVLNKSLFIATSDGFLLEFCLNTYAIIKSTSAFTAYDFGYDPDPKYDILHNRFKIKVSPSGELILTENHKRIAKVYESTSFTEVMTFDNAPSILGFTYDSKHLITEEEKALWVYEIPGKEKIFFFDFSTFISEKEYRVINSVKGNYTHLAIMTDFTPWPESILFLDIKSNRLIQKMVIKNDLILDEIFSHNQKYFLLNIAGNEAIIYDTQKFQIICSFSFNEKDDYKYFNGVRDEIFSRSTSHSGSILSFGKNDDSVFVASIKSFSVEDNRRIFGKKFLKIQKRK